MVTTHKEMLSRHLHYEFWMLGETFLLLEAGVPKGVWGNACIEAFSMHARNLMEFFEKKASTHFATAVAFADASYEPLSKRIVREELRTKLNNQLVHLTWGRTVNDSQKFDADDRREVIRVLERERAHFVAHLLPAHTADWSGITLPMVPAR